MSELSDFLLARIAEDEARVDTVPDWYCTESARGTGWGSRGDCQLCGAYMFDGTEVVTEQAMWEHLDDAHGRARVLAECAAKRQIVEEHSNSKGECATCLEYVSIWNEDYAMKEWPCPTLRALAAVYADHPAFRAEWVL